MIGKTNYYDYLTLIPPSKDPFTPSDGLTYRYYYESDTAWELALLTSGSIKFRDNISCNIFMVGGGKNGANGQVSHLSGGNIHYYTGLGGTGGAGGECINTSSPIAIAKNHKYPIVIGDNDNNTTGFGLTAISGGGAAGGVGNAALRYLDRNEPLDNTAGEGSKPGTTSTEYAFDNIWNSYFYPNVTFGAGGGGGGATAYRDPIYSGAPSQYYTSGSTGSIGGFYGGGTGGTASAVAPCDSGTDGTAGMANMGAGGGGGSAAGGGSWRDIEDTYQIELAGGAGGTGIIIIHPANFTGFSTFDKYYLFINGTFATARIGSWTTNGAGSQAINARFLDMTYTKASNTSYKRVLFSTNNAIDLTSYSKITLDIENTNIPAYMSNHVSGASSQSSTTYIYLLVADSITQSWDGNGLPTATTSGKYVQITAKGTYTLDISDVTGAKYIQISIVSDGYYSDIYNTVNNAPTLRVTYLSIEK